MAEGGRKLAFVRDQLEKACVAGENALAVEDLATKLIIEAGGKPSFKMVPGYSWSTCINVNDGVVHGIPKAQTVFKNGDIVSVDVGMFYKGFHTDTSTSVVIEGTKEQKKFLGVGKEALHLAIEAVRIGNEIADISRAMQSTLQKAKYSPIKALTGHGVGRDLHEDPYVPCFVTGTKADHIKIEEGMVLAIEVMYAKGGSDIALAKDGWTIVTADGTISALFEETVAVTSDGPLVLTKA